MITEEHHEKWLAMGYDPTTWTHRKLFVETILNHKPTTVLDVGCATGPDLALIHLVDPTIKLYGFDLDPKNITQAKELLPTAHLWEADITDGLPMTEHAFDVVYSNGVIMYVSPQWIQEMVRISHKATILSERGNPTIYSEIINATHHTPTFTPVTTDIRESWANDGFIIEIPKHQQ